MREFAFRAWDTKKNRMIDDFLNFAGLEAMYNMSNPWHDDRYIKEQFTGLTDKNGTRIFEGDILKWSNGGTLTVTYESRKESKTYGQGCYGYARIIGFSIDDYYGDTCMSEVIGNIHKAKEQS